MGLSIDRDKVVKGLQYCFTTANCDGCPYETECRKISFKTPENHCQILDDVLTLLKEQEAVKPKSKVRHGANAQIQHFCGNCNTMLHGKPKYCLQCGRKVKWNDKSGSN